MREIYGEDVEPTEGSVLKVLLCPKLDTSGEYGLNTVFVWVMLFVWVKLGIKGIERVEV